MTALVQMARRPARVGARENHGPVREYRSTARSVECRPPCRKMPWRCREQLPQDKDAQQRDQPVGAERTAERNGRDVLQGGLLGERVQAARADLKVARGAFHRRHAGRYHVPEPRFLNLQCYQQGCASMWALHQGGWMARADLEAVVCGPGFIAPTRDGSRENNAALLEY